REEAGACATRGQRLAQVAGERRQLLHDDVVDPRPRFVRRRLGGRRDEAIGVLGALRPVEVEAPVPRDRFGELRSWARDAAVEHRLAILHDDDIGALVADVDHRDRAIRACASEGWHALDELYGGATGGEDAARLEADALAEVDQLFRTIPTHRVREHA